MTKRSFKAAFGFGCLALLCLAQESPVSAQRGGGSRGGSSSAGASSGGGARASAPSHSSSSGSGSSGGGSSAPRASAPARSSPPPSSAPRSQPAPSAPRYQPPATPRYQPAETGRSQPTSSPRYLPPDNSGHSYDGGRRAADPTPTTSRGSTEGRSDAPGSSDAGRFDPRDHDNGAAPREQDSDGSWNNLTFERRAPRTTVPALSGSDRGPASQRFGLSQRRAAAASGRTSASGEGLVRIPHAEVTREAILERYRSTPVREGQPRGETNGVGELSRARTETAPLRTQPDTAPGATTSRGATNPSTARTAAPARGSVEAARRERESVDHLDRLRAAHPERARAIDEAGARVARATDAATQVTIAAGVGFGTGIWGGWLCQPCNSSCNTNWNNGSWYWYGCYGWPVWCSSGYGSCWPYGWGFSWWGSGWGLSYSSCNYSPWSYGYCYPNYGYSGYGYGSPSPTYYSTVIYQDDQAPAYQPEQPVANGEAYVDNHAQIAAPAQMGRGVSQYLSLGDEAFSQGRYSEAVNAYARAVEASPDEGVLYLILSDALFATGDYHYAAFALRRSLELDPTLLASVVDKHNFYGDPAEFDQQILLAENYLDEHFLDDDARLVLAANYLFANRPAQSSDLLQSAFSKSVRESTAGRLLLQRAEELRKEHPSAK